MALDVGQLEVIDTVFDLLLTIDLAVRVDAIEVDRPDLGPLLEIHDDPLQPIGDLHADGVQTNASGLLEIGELCDLLAVEPDFPAETPRSQSGRFPVVFDEADVMPVAFQANGLEAAQIEFLRVSRVRFEQHLILGVHLHAVWIFGVTAVIGAKGRLYVCDVPRLGP